MSRYRGSYQYSTIDDRPLLGPAEDILQETESNHSSEKDDYYYNREAEEEAKMILEGWDDLLSESSETPVKKCDSPTDNHDNGPLPLWYKKKLDSKIRETKDRLEILSNIVSNVCPYVAAHIKRIEQDHRGMTFCQMDYPRHPSLNKPWTNSWKFNCAIKCKEANKPTHSHTDRCKSQVVLEHVDTGVSIETPNICPNEYPQFVMDAVELFQNFANEDMINVPFSDVQGAPEISLWTGIKLVLRSNYKNELMMVVRGKKLGPIKYQLRKYFDHGPGSYSNVISVSVIDQGWKKNMNKIEPERIAGFFKLRDQIGSVSIEYKPKISVDFNSIETALLGQIIKDYAGLTAETTLLDIGCSFGILSLMMSKNCERVFGLNTMHAVNNDLAQAEEIKKFNGIENVSFIGCNPEDLITRCSAYVKGYITVAVVNLVTPYGKSKHTMDALRNIPSIWRVIVYGPFTKDYRQNIAKLTIENDAKGDSFLPMKGCILDKSPSAENAFDIVILFERSSLITPKMKLEVLASGPTMNVKTDFEAGKYEPLDAEELKPKVSVDRNQNLQNSEEKYRNSPPYSSLSSCSRKYNRSPSPSRSVRSPSPSRSVRLPSPRRSVRSPSPSSSIRSPSPRRSVRSPSPRRSQRYSPPRRSQHSPSSRRFQRSSSPKRSRRSPSPRRSQHSPSSRRSQRSSSPKRSRRSPSPTRSQRSPSLRRSHHSPSSRKSKRSSSPRRSHARSPSPNRSTARRIKTEPTEDILPPNNKNRSPPFSWPMPHENNELEKQNDRQLHEEKRDETTPSYPSLSVRKEFQFSCPTPPRERPPSPPMDTSLHIDASTNKEEYAGWNIPSWTTVISEPETEPVVSDEVPSQLATGDSAFLRTTIKSEPIDSYEPLVVAENDISPAMTLNSELVNRQNISAQLETCDGVPVTVKSEPADSHELRDENFSELAADQSPPASLYEDVPLPIIVKSEPVDTFKVPTQLVKNEPRDIETSPNTQDFQNMETPIHNPRPVSSSSNAVFANLDGFEFSLDATKSYMTSTREPEIPNTTLNVKTEPAEKEVTNEEIGQGNEVQSTEKSANVSIKTEIEERERVDTDEEIKIVDEKRMNSIANISSIKMEFEDDKIEIVGEKKSEQQTESKPKIRVKTEDEVKVKSEAEETDDEDIRTLIERRKKLLEKLNQEVERRHKKELPRSYKRQSSRSPSSSSSRKHDRSPSSSSRRSARSPSPYRHRSPSSKRRRRSPYRSRRSPSPSYRRSRRSPSSPVRVKREPYSPDRSSVSSRRGERSKRSPSTSSFKREVYGPSRDRLKKSRSKSPKRRKSKSP